MDESQLLALINQAYPLNIQHIKLYREMIGKVYVISSPEQQYILKIYRSNRTQDALQSVQILDYLQDQGYPAVSARRTREQRSHIRLPGPDGGCIGIVFGFVDGEVPDANTEAAAIGEQTGELHNLMELYPHQLIHRSKTEYIGDYLSIMQELGYDTAKTGELQQYGDELWERIAKLPRSFCHGDLHTGNMLRTASGVYVLLDFDDASGDYPSMDVAYMADDTHFNDFHEPMYERTLRLYERFYAGYRNQRTQSAAESSAVFDFIAVRHFQIIARIARCQGTHTLSQELCEQQYGWLMRWRELCARNRPSL